MREQDKKECEKVGSTPKEAVFMSVGQSNAYSLFINDELAGIYGWRPSVHPVTGGYAALVWFLTTDTVEKYKKTFYQESMRAIQLLAKNAGPLYNLVDVEYTAALNWLARCGFVLHGNRIAKGPKGDRFILVTRVAWEEV